MTIQTIQEMQFDQLPLRVYASNELLGQAAAEEASTSIQEAIAVRQCAHVILATGNSQLSTLQALVERRDIDWSKVYFFHMDEYIGIDPSHPAGFARFLNHHFFSRLPARPAAFHTIPILEDPDNRDAVEAACRDYDQRLREHPADLCLMGIGENGHIAFNDPPYARFDDPVWVKPVRLAEQSRQQQVGEGHFRSLAETPTQALTLTIPALLAARKLLAVVPERRKAEAVRAALLGPVTENLPASILRRQVHAILFLDSDSASLL